MKKAFTLAEVLITLGVIGVVAAMTMPSLVANYQKKVWVNQLKKTVSVMNQAFQKMLADDGVDSLADTEVFSSIVGNCIASYGYNNSKCTNFYSELKKYLSIVEIGKTGAYKYQYIKKGSIPFYPDNNQNSAKFVLADGTMFIKYNITSAEQKSSYSCSQIRANGGRMCSKMGNITIDVNGERRPNIEGRDIFNFNISSAGYLVPYYGIDDSVYGSGDLSNTWKNNIKACGTPGVADAVSNAQYGSGCAARIIDNGWEMDY